MTDVNGLHGSGKETIPEENAFTAATPLHIKQVKELLNLEPVFRSVEQLLDQTVSPFGR